MAAPLMAINSWDAKGEEPEERLASSESVLMTGHFYCFIVRPCLFTFCCPRLDTGESLAPVNQYMGPATIIVSNSVWS